MFVSDPKDKLSIIRKFNKGDAMSWIREIALPMLPLVIIGVLLLFAAVWSRKKSEKTNHEKPMAWFFFYIYCVIPVSIYYSVYYAIAIKVVYIQIVLSLIVFTAFISFLGLYKFKSWGWIVNYILLVFSMIGFSISLTKNNMVYFSLIKTALFFVIWVVPNIIYFKKRAHLKSIRTSTT
jgi:hypothetical protein